MRLSARKRLLAALLLLAVSALLYFPWRNNPLVFDDANILKSTALYDYAEVPFSLTPRQFPYFTLGFENVVSNGSLQVSRCVTLVLHAVNGLLLFMLGYQLFGRVISERRALIVALGVALFFVAHPVAVYAAGYLVQRTVLFATLFLLLSALQLDRALLDKSWLRAGVAGVCFGLSVLSKEHALTGFIAVAGLLFLHRPLMGLGRGRVILSFFVTALPFALWVTSLKLGFVAVAYEPDAQALMSAVGFPDKGSAIGNWVLSASLQCLFFFRYFAAWCWPNPSGLTIDIRPDIDFLSNSPWIILGPVCFIVLAGVTVFALLSKRVRPELKLAAFGLLWAGSLFLVELSTVRFQEAVVLYRSYLWAPGFLLAIAGVVSLVSTRLMVATFAVAAALAAPLAWGRLSTFSDELVLWQEAAQKLPQPDTPGAMRIHYNMGIFYARAKQMDAALKEFDWVISKDPQSFHGYWGRSAIYLSQGDVTRAIGDLQMVIQLKPAFGMAYFQLGGVLKSLGRKEESDLAFSQSERLGVPHVEFK